MPGFRSSSFLRTIAVGAWVSLSLQGQAQILIEFLQQPSNAVIHPCRNVTFAVVARATEDGTEIGPPGYQWQGQPLGTADWTDIVGATAASYVPSPPWSSSPAKFRCQVAVRGQMVVSTAAELIIDTNCLRPTVVSAVGFVPQNTTVVRFSEPMDPIMTLDNFNYSAGPNFNVTPIQVLIVDPFTVVLEWWSDELNLQLGQTYPLRVDLAVAASDPQCSCNFIIGAEVDFMTERGPEIEVLQHPNDAVVLLGNIATFSAN